MTNYTKNIRTKKIIFQILSFVLLVGVAATYLIIAISGLPPADDAETETLREQLGSIIYPLTITLITLIGLLIIVGHKIRTTIWMFSVALACYMWGTTGMWITFAIWIIDEYVIFNLANMFKNKYIINKEIDKRE